MLVGNNFYRLTLYKDFLELKIYDFDSRKLIRGYYAKRKEEIAFKNSPIYSKTDKGVEFEKNIESTRRLLSRMSDGYGFIHNDFVGKNRLNFKIGAYLPGTAFMVTYYGGDILTSGLISAGATLLASAIAAQSFEYSYFNLTLDAKTLDDLPYEEVPPIIRRMDVFEQYLWRSGNQASELIYYRTNNVDYVTFYNRTNESIDIYKIDL